MDVLSYLARKGNPTNGLSPLAADMLRMYLSGKTDKKLIERVRLAIVSSQTFKDFSEYLVAEIARNVGGRNAPLTQSEWVQLASASADNYRETDSKGNKRRIYFDKNGLQPVIGGVTAFKVEDVSVKTKGLKAEFVVTLRVGDSYDFDNNRKDFKDYDEYRKHLASLFSKGMYSSFWLAYHKSLYGMSGPLNQGNVFASFMYAVEQGGCFNPVSWETSVTVSGAAAYKPSLPKK